MKWKDLEYRTLMVAIMMKPISVDRVYTRLAMDCLSGKIFYLDN